QEVMEEKGVHGVYFQAESRRFYPSPNRLTHVLGYTDHEHVGREGVERTMNEVMAGKDGYRYIERNNRGQEIAAFRGEEVLPVHGSNVRLTIDMGMQNIVERGLARGVERFQPEKISTVWMDPYTGEILSMASRPDFDLNTREGNRRNIAIADQYEPGSTFKIVAVGGALDQNLLHLQTQIFCHWGQMTEHNGLIVKDHHPYGDLTTELVVAKSSNIGAYKVAKLLGPVRLHQYMGYFGFGERTGIKLTGEVAGRVYHPDEWSGTSFSSMAMGYEVAVTPLQMATALSAVANGGLLMQPRVISTIENDNEEVLEKTDTRVVRRVLSSAAADSMRRAMMAVTAQGGTATRANFPGYLVAGKTGTARKYSAEAKGYLDGRYVCSFMGFFPADNPRVVGIVVVDDPVKPADDPEMPLYGGTVAAPIFAEMAAKIAAYLEIPASTPPTDLVQNQPLANATRLPR
ncbi:MAG: penicillin-binding protein 2, partial [Verrucomicrobiota bacterium]